MTQTNLYLHQGTDFSTEVILRNARGVVINPTGYTIEAVMDVPAASSIRKSITTTPIATFTTTVISAVNGIVRLELGYATTTTLKEGRYSFSLYLISGITRNKILEGVATVNYTVL